MFQSRIHTAPHERLALSRIKEESVHIGEVKCHRSTAGGIKGAAARSRDGAEGFASTEADGEESAVLWMDSIKDQTL